MISFEDYHFWDGEELLERGDIVKLVCHGNQLFQVKYVGKEDVVVQRPCGKETFVARRNILCATNK